MSLQRAAKLGKLNSPRAARYLSVLTLTLFLLVFAHPHPAQKEAAPSDEVVRVSTHLVTIPVFVTDSRGRRISGLTKGEFEVLDEGTPVETNYFAAGAERVALFFLLDASGSTRDIITQQRETALALFSRFGERSRIAVAHFDEQTELSLPFTTDIGNARAAFRANTLSARRTAIFDAALAAVRAFKTGEQQPTERRIVILISDGLDTASTARASTVIAEALESGVSFYVIHLPLYAPRDGRLAARRPSRGVRELAEKTGGQFFSIGDAASALDPRAELDLRPVFRAIADDLAGQYVIGYYADAAQREARARRVQIRLTSQQKRKLRVRQLRDEYTLKR
ncbi:MAG TPA: VWA domain-containing protein [Pyrinomonadaceae bacterium]|nr:VWA domain-containing protein [Pyrinomonadaceae bacterium]